MPRPTPHVSAAALAAAGALALAGCSSGPAEPGTAASSAAVVLTDRGARQALLSETWLGSQWTGTTGTAADHDGLVRAVVDKKRFLTHRANAAACQTLLDRLSQGRLLPPSAGSAHAVAVFDGEDGGRLRYEVGAYPSAELTEARRWMADLPVTCDGFTALRPDGGRESVDVSGLDVPAAGDSRQALLVTVKGSTDGVPFTLSLNVALVTVDDSAITLVNGGLTGASTVTTRQAVRLGGERLKTVMNGGTLPARLQDDLD
ncbi:hypothetical protein [Streptomyces sp. NPDC057694]|uniref:hypothetical protein n=1 Tax=Streptomyces sp. NPDC057694 TaxID=3346216 RepID=UPI0036C32703